MTTQRILVIEDDKSILMGLEDDLKLEGYEVRTALDGVEGLSFANERRHDLIVLDIMLPRMNGFEVCRQLRQRGITTPILMLTARGREADKVLGLELGADDYVTKPFSPRELLARIKAILRRVEETQRGSERSRFGNVKVDFKKYEVKKADQPVYLTSLEFALLRLLVNHKGEVLSRDEILDGVWGKNVFVDNRTVDTHIAHLRRKLEDDPTKPKYIEGIRGIGYRLHDSCESPL